MNKIFVSALAGVALMSGLSACSDNEGDIPVSKGLPCETTLTVKVPETFRSRAAKLFGEGAQGELSLSYAIYSPDGAIVYSSELDGSPEPTQTNPGEWSITVRLMSEDAYTAVFFADQFGAVEDEAIDPYVVDFNAATLTVDYEKSMAVENLVNDRADAYILYQSFIAGKSTTFTMKRPFCQVNIGSNEDEIKNVDGTYHQVPTRIALAYDKSSDEASLPNVLNFKTGKVTGAGGNVSNGDIEMIASSFDDKDFDFPINNAVQYMYMAYILAPQTSDGWGDGGNIDDLTLNLALGKSPFTGELREPYHVTGAKNFFLANTRLILAPQCTDLGGEEGGGDPDPDPDPDKPGFIEGNCVLNIVYDPGFSGTTVKNIK